jgi:hypothetical protein
MGSILSSNTIYAVAYLTELGRKLLFDPMSNDRFSQDGNRIIDAFKITYFSMSDPDYNYNITSGFALATGDISNISGKNDDCIKGTVITEETNLISVNGGVAGISQVDVDDDVLIDIDDTPYVLSTDGTSENAVVVNIHDFSIINE